MSSQGAWNPPPTSTITRVSLPPIMPLVIPSDSILFINTTLNRRIAPSAAPFHS
jgi:hypothetical protein